MELRSLYREPERQAEVSFGALEYHDVFRIFRSGPAETVALCEATAREALKAMNLNMGACHVELRLTADGPRLIEVNGRLAGDRIPTSSS